MKSILIKNCPSSLHTAAKTIAAHQGISLNKLILDAIHAYTMQVAIRERITGTVIEALESRMPD